jgi:hypothetical protein
MRTGRWLLILTIVGSTGCRSHFTPERAAKVEDSVRAYMRTVAQDVTKDGPTAWRKHFADSPGFFVAVNGQMAIPTRAAAMATIQDRAHSLKRIDLQWGQDLRVDPLTQDLAVIATSYREVRVSMSGDTVDENGFFTAVVEHHDENWRIRDAHWSVPVPGGH